MSNNEVKQGNWQEAGFSPYLSNSISELDQQFMSAENFNQNMQDGSVTTSKVKELRADKITTGILQSSDGLSSWDLDGEKRIIISDGTDSRVLLGLGTGLF